MKFDKGSTWGVPEKQIEEADTNYGKIDDEIKLKDTELKHILKDTAQNNNNIIELWVLLYKYTCISLVNYADTKSATIIDKNNVRIGLAKETFEEWEKINKEQPDYIIPNFY